MFQFNLTLLPSNSVSSQKYGFGTRDPRSGIRKRPIPVPGSRGQKGTGSQIPDPQHWKKDQYRTEHLSTSNDDILVHYHYHQYKKNGFGSLSTTSVVEPEPQEPWFFALAEPEPECITVRSEGGFATGINVKWNFFKLKKVKTSGQLSACLPACCFCHWKDKLLH